MRRLPLGIVVAIALLVLYFNFSVFDSPVSTPAPQAAEPAVGTTAPATAAATFAAVTAPPRPAGPPMPGVLVALTTHKHLLSRVVREDSRWEPLSRDELSFGGLYATIIVARRRADAPPSPEEL